VMSLKLDIILMKKIKIRFWLILKLINLHL
jgi:hypothetical protein